MSSFEWSDAELIVAIYFTSRGFFPEIVAEFLARRQLLRSLDSIHAKMLEITSTNPTLSMEGGVWDVQAVDKFIDGLSLDHDAVSQLIRFTESDVKIVEKFQPLAVAIRNLNLRSEVLQYWKTSLLLL